MTEDRVLDKLQKIKAHADSAAKIGNEAEAQAFAEMLQRLLLKHNLEMSDLEFERHEREEPVIEHLVDWTTYGLENKLARSAWEQRLASVVARAHFCRIMVQPGSNRVTFVGRKSDIAVAEYLTVVLVRSARRIADQAYNDMVNEGWREKVCDECGQRWPNHQGKSRTVRDHLFSTVRHHGFRPAFLQAFVMRIAQRLEETRRSNVTTSTAIVRVNRAEKAVEDYMGQFKRKAAGLTHARFHAEGARRGREMADRVDLSARAVESSSPRGSLKGE